MTISMCHHSRAVALRRASDKRVHYSTRYPIWHCLFESCSCSTRIGWAASQRTSFLQADKNVPFIDRSNRY